MTNESSKTVTVDLSELYADTDYLNLEVNKGQETIHAKRMAGRFRTYQWVITSMLYGPYFLLCYLTWDGRQAFLMDIPGQKFYFGGFVLWPQDFWIVALLLLFSFVLLFAMTSMAGRIFCGFVCPQTTFVNFMAAIENLVEGKPAKRIALDAGPWNLNKVVKKSVKHFLWLSICTVTAITFIGYFIGIEKSWHDFFTLQYGGTQWFTYISIVLLFYINCGFVREQVCMWVCPYCRIQGVLSDFYTKVVTYDFKRGEPRGKFKKGAERTEGDCIECNMCVAVCPTGVDIRTGYQIGCTNCGVCIDACDSVMDKIGKARGLIRFASEKEMETGEKDKHIFVNARSSVYAGITVIVLGIMIAGLYMKSDIDLNVRHVRAPLFTQMSDGSIQNTYKLNFINKTENAVDYELIVSGIEGATTNADGKIFHVRSGEVKRFTLNVRAPEGSTTERQDFELVLKSKSDDSVKIEYQTMFIAPKN